MAKQEIKVNKTARAEERKNAKLAQEQKKREKALLAVQKAEENKLKKQRHKQEKAESKQQKKQAKIDLRAQKKQVKQQKRKDLATRIIERNKVVDWMNLDNAGTIYPSINEEHWNFVVRVSANLKKPVDPEVLQRAVDQTMPRFPSFNVRLKSGVFWNYFEQKNTFPKVKEEKKFPCARIELKNPKKHVVRVLYYRNRVSVEVFHGVADGRGVLTFFNTILRRYFVLNGEQVEGFEGSLNSLDKPKLEEISDAFVEYYNTDKKLPHKEVKAFKIKGTQEEFGVNNTTIGKLSVAEVKTLAKAKGCTITELLTAVMAFSILKKYKNIKRPIKVSVPIDLRNFFPSETLRNFSGYKNVEVFARKEPYSLDEVIQIVKDEFATIDKEFLSGFINSNAGLHKNWAIKIVPLFIKSFVMKLCFKFWGEAYQTLALSNLGLVKAPKGFENLIDDYAVNLGRPKYNAKGLGVISFGDVMTCTFSSKIREMTVERLFFTTLSDLGLNITIESNRRDLYGE